MVEHILPQCSRDANNAFYDRGIALFGHIFVSEMTGLLDPKSSKFHSYFAFIVQIYIFIFYPWVSVIGLQFSCTKNR